ncbi:hypothetical protein ES708_26224 [subsurface metagenome]
MVNEIRLVGNKIECEDNDLGDKRSLKEFADRSVVFGYRRVGLYYPSSGITAGAYAATNTSANNIDVFPFVVSVPCRFYSILNY